jgi:hypothetical protein
MDANGERPARVDRAGVIVVAGQWGTFTRTVDADITERTRVSVVAQSTVASHHNAALDPITRRARAGVVVIVETNRRRAGCTFPVVADLLSVARIRVRARRTVRAWHVSAGAIRTLVNGTHVAVIDALPAFVHGGGLAHHVAADAARARIVVIVWAHIAVVRRGGLALPSAVAHAGRARVAVGIGARSLSVRRNVRTIAGRITRVGRTCVGIVAHTDPDPMQARAVCHALVERLQQVVGERCPHLCPHRRIEARRTILQTADSVVVPLLRSAAAARLVELLLSELGRGVLYATVDQLTDERTQAAKHSRSAR